MMRVTLLSGDTVEAPEWARFVAVDCNGAVFAYADKPRFYRDAGDWFGRDSCMFLTRIGSPGGESDIYEVQQ